MEGEKVSYIRDVWAENLESEMSTIREMIVSYPCISMDTEFPGVVVKPVGSFKSGADYLYQTLRVNVDLLKIIQVRTRLRLRHEPRVAARMPRVLII